MPVTPFDFLHFGQSTLSRVPCSEMEARNAYRCAYYAVHHSAKQALPRLGVSLIKAKRGGAHADVEASLLQVPSSEVAVIVAQMQRLKKFRVDCDYHLDKTLLPETFAMRLADAEDAFASLQQIGVPQLETCAE